MDQTANEKSLLGKITKIGDSYIKALISIDGVKFPAEFPKAAIEKAGLEARIGVRFYWISSSRKDLLPEEYYSVDSKFYWNIQKIKK